MKVIITGVTGMVGEGVLHECLSHPSVLEVLVVNRKPCGKSHPKLKEIIHNNFYELSSIEDELKGYDGCFFCLGVTSVGLTEESYSRISYDLTLQVASTLARLNPEMVFCYVSGSGTDSSERGRSMWARVKGRTENHLMWLPFRRAYMFRPGYLHPTPGLSNGHRYYKWLSPLYYLLRPFLPNQLLTLRQLGLAMIHSVSRGYPKAILETKDIAYLSKPEGAR
ncbi:epimerase [Paenibacillus sp. LHD-117]|uniref:NAD-dependent epimerase/dehydratase family protein n=1 Tax=Paenibacillus sp. LHD-117 TaxID=3071412 RepID=UPI0027E000A9|nr:NAD-dependent epimerase/dehydratase family protein [Paenibacillus sp. LHD-117]MDQ6421739.1 epimerase [Paenibacillus sp. LHD-117]